MRSGGVVDRNIYTRARALKKKNKKQELLA